MELIEREIRRGTQAACEVTNRDSYEVYRVPPSEKMKAGGHGLFLPQEQIQISRLIASGRTEDILPLQTAAKSLTSFPAPGRSRFHPLERETR